LIYLDTHVTLWLLRDPAAIPRRAQQLVEAEDVTISPMVTLELQYLYEIGRIRASADHIVHRLRTAIGLEECALPFPVVSATARTLNWTRDPFDRIIVAHAITSQASLITKDAKIAEHFAGAVWE